MVDGTRTVIHDEHTHDTIIIKNTLLPINKGEFIDITTSNEKQIKGNVIRIHNDIGVAYDDTTYSHCVHIYVY